MLRPKITTNQDAIAAVKQAIVWCKAQDFGRTGHSMSLLLETLLDVEDGVSLRAAVPSRLHSQLN